MTNKEKIQNLDTDALAKLLVNVEYHITNLVPKEYTCEISCHECKDFRCYKQWLESECKEVPKFKLYRKMCRPYKVYFGDQGISERWEPLEGLYPAESEPMLREKYEPIFNDPNYKEWAGLKFQYMYVEWRDGNFVVEDE